MSSRSIETILRQITGGITLLLLLAGCAQQPRMERGEEREMTQGEMIEMGKEALSYENAELAITIFDRILTEYDPEDDEAKFGYVLAGIQNLVHMTEQIVSLLREADVEPEKTSVDVYGIIERLMKQGYRQEGKKWLRMLDEILLDEPSFTFTIDAYPIHLLGMPLISWKGEFDVTDLHLLKSVTHLFIAAIDVVLVSRIDLQVDPDQIETFFGEDITLEGVLRLGNRVLQQLAEMEIVTYDAPDDLRDLGDNLGLALFEWREALKSARRERDPQQDDLLRYLGEDRFLLPGGTIFTITPGLLDLFQAISASILDGGSYDVEPDRPNLFDLADLNTYLAEAYATRKNPENYEDAVTWAATQLMIAYVDHTYDIEDWTSVFAPDCVQIDLGLLFTEDVSNALRPFVQTAVDAQILPSLADLIVVEGFEACVATVNTPSGSIEACNVAVSGRTENLVKQFDYFLSSLFRMNAAIANQSPECTSPAPARTGTALWP
ncbi:MAG: hypothetical protein D6812_15235 [Deltaproteobacteria bacterium]|nr:MAG: hypothetical protein D6812_15235 [Deltaproteobacteria bacterium]